ncbi:methyltransferase domain-containing protein [Streptomyces sp. TRM70308]|uniref:methyltransferase domain-containing protein n=1 Tax=Streptomyces sp. TRM70308 TaxID=3131932 RepID=UPI003D00F719
MTTQRDLVRALERSGAVPEPWRDAVAAVDRALFIPPRFGGHNVAADPEAWRAAVYSDVPIITQVNDGRELGDDAFERPSSSSSMPSLMLEMLDLLQVRDGDRVLEIGTGTGYHAAWLCHRLGQERVTTIEYDPGLAERARRALAAAGFAPRVLVGDGLAGDASGAPYDRVIATCTLRDFGRLVAQCPNGRIVAPWGSSFFHASFATVDVRDGVGTGRLSGDPSFMWDRVRPAGAGHIRDYYHDQSGDPGRTRVPPQNVLQTDPAFFVSLHVTDAWYRWSAADDDSGEATLWLFADDKRSWATVEYAPRTAEFETDQYGPRRLWDEVEAAFRRWEALGSPARDRFGLTVGPDGHPSVWLDDPATPVAPASP